MKLNTFLERLNQALNSKTLYVMGGWGYPLNAANKARTQNNKWNTDPTRKKMIDQATGSTFAFDCVNLIKGILWGWDGSTGKKNGGATYAANGVPDYSANDFINLCSPTTDFSKIQPGWAVWMPGHIGVYVGDGKVIECSPKWENCVQLTYLVNLGYKNGNCRIWNKCGPIPFVDYTEKVDEVKYKDQDNAWSREARKACVKAGLFSGYTDGFMHWEDGVTREQLAYILYKAGVVK